MAASAIVNLDPRTKSNILSSAASQVRGTSQELARQAETLGREVGDFLSRVRVA
jgi:methyl-accepting chemotaxis protein